MPEYTAPGAIARLQGETFASFDARQKAHRLAAMKPKRVRKPRARKPASSETFETKLDDTGLSPDV